MCMKKRGNLVLIFTVLLTMLIVGVFNVYNKNKESKKVYQAYLEIHQEYEVSEVKSITITSINNNIVISQSKDEKVKVSFFQKQENSNEFNLVDGKLNINIIEKVEDLSNMFFSPQSSIDTISLYLPEGYECDIDIIDIQGSLKVDDVNVKSLRYEGITGDIKVANSSGNKLVLKSNSGEINIESCLFNHYDLYNVSNNVNLSLESLVSDFNIEAKTNYGKLKLNKEDVYEDFTNEETGETVTSITKHLLLHSENNNSISITSVKGTIYLNLLTESSEEVDTTTEAVNS